MSLLEIRAVGYEDLCNHIKKKTFSLKHNLLVSFQFFRSSVLFPRFGNLTVVRLFLSGAIH